MQKSHFTKICFSYEKVSTVVIPEGPVELKTTAYIDEKNWGPST
eukprot:COSAG02_NODE_71854_length_189_cov_32.111111_1_plen_43_part_01